MGRLSNVLRNVEGGLLSFRCPGCEEMHAVRVEGPEAWGWDGNIDAPTFTLSVLVTGGHFSPNFQAGEACWCTYNLDHPDDPAPFSCKRCHSYVEKGQIRFLADCSHALVGQTIPLPILPMDGES